jgi:hypothetical protein
MDHGPWTIKVDEGLLMWYRHGVLIEPIMTFPFYADDRQTLGATMYFRLAHGLDPHVNGLRHLNHLFPS